MSDFAAKDLHFALTHHLLVFVLAGVLAFEIGAVRTDTAGKEVLRVARADACYGLLAAAIIAVGFSRAVFAAKGWNLDTSGVNDPGKGAGNISNGPGIAGLSDAQLKGALPGGFDTKVWVRAPGVKGSYPYLIANPPR